MLALKFDCLILSDVEFKMKINQFPGFYSKMDGTVQLSKALSSIFWIS